MVDLSFVGIVEFMFYYFVLYLFFVILKSSSDLGDKFIFCPVCVAWFSHLILAVILGYPLILIVFMLGMTVTGISYFLKEKYLEKTHFLFDFFIIQLVLTTIGVIIIKLMEVKNV